MADDIPATLTSRANAQVLEYVKDLSAHSDIASMLRDAVRPLGDVQVFCPDPAAYRFLVVSTLGIVFGIAVGSSSIAFRLDAQMKDRALATGGALCPECGDDWAFVVRDRPDDDWPAVDVQFWARKAYVHARSLARR